MKTDKVPKKLKKPVIFYDSANKLKRLNLDGSVDEFTELSKYLNISSELFEYKNKSNEYYKEVQKLKGDIEHLRLCHINLKQLLSDHTFLCDRALRKAHATTQDIDVQIKCKTAVEFLNKSGTRNLLDYKPLDREAL